MKKDFNSLIRLFLTTDIGNRTLLRMISDFNSLDDVIRLSDKELSLLYKLNQKTIDILRNNQKQVDAEINLIEKNDIRIISIKDNDYPEILHRIPNPPCVLYFKGNMDLLNKTSIAIVGSRYASINAKEFTLKTGFDFSVSDIVVVSGFALGIDTEAHKGAIDGGGNTIVVLGSGMSFMYPEANNKLIPKILENNGLFISEFSMRTPPSTITFPQRNRIISGLSTLGVIVVEAALRSGSLITARYAKKQGKQLYAVPGSPNSHFTEGSNQLIKDGAVLFENIDDILNINKINNNFQKKQIENVLTKQEKYIVDLLSKKPMGIEEIGVKAGKNNLTLADANSILMRLELKKIVKKIPGMKFARI